MNQQELSSSLNSFTGTENYYFHNMVQKMHYTDGVRHFAQNAGGGAYWFLDEIAFEIFPLHVSQPFMLIELQVKDTSANIMVSDGDNHEVFTKHIGYTDCPEGDWKFYLIDNIVLLTSEY